MGQGFQNPDLNFEQLYDQAGQAMPELQDYGQNFLQYLKDKYPGQFDGVHFEQAPIKASDRALVKIKTDYAGDHTKIADLVRGRLVVETPDQIQIIRKEMVTLEKSMGIEKFKDFYVEPMDNHFRAINTQVRLPSGHVAEFRIDQRDMVIAADNTHAIYEEKQQIEREAASEHRPFTDDEARRHQSILDEQRVEFDRASHKGNLDSLVNEKGAIALESHRNSRMASLADTFGTIGKNGGLVAGVVVGGLTVAFSLASGSSPAQAAEVGFGMAMPYGESQLDALRGDTEALKRSATIETASNIGAAGGALGGAAIGTMIFPGPGTAVGAVVGGIGMGIASGQATAIIYDRADDIGDFFDRSDDRLFERLPTDIPESAPPELQHLVELKRLYVDATDAREILGRNRTRNKDLIGERREASGRIKQIETLYDEAYEQYEGDGQLAESTSYLRIWEMAGEMAQVSPGITAGHDSLDNRAVIAAQTSDTAMRPGG